MELQEINRNENRSFYFICSTIVEVMIDNVHACHFGGIQDLKCSIRFHSVFVKVQKAKIK